MLDGLRIKNLPQYNVYWGSSLAPLIIRRFLKLQRDVSRGFLLEASFCKGPMAREKDSKIDGLHVFQPPDTFSYIW